MARQEDTLSAGFDARWGKIEYTHRSVVSRFLSSVAPDGKVLDAACGTGKYFGMVLESGRAIHGVDHSAGPLSVAASKFPEVPTETMDLQDLPFDAGFDGVVCLDPRECVPPEEWPVVLERFRRALRPDGRLYLTVELASDELLLRANREARRKGHPVVDGEAMWDEPDGYYHYHPSMDRVRAWLTAAGFRIEEDTEGPWEDGEYAYHHVRARLEEPSGVE
jgi:ubiquinone/menaquinone biosynthesis C-methylase UbiE